jgi:hypothetical protein
MLVYLGKTASYFLAIISTVISLVLYGILYSSRIFGVLCYNERISKFISAIIALVALVSCVATVGYSCESFGVFFLKKSPFLYILSFIILAIVCASRFGIKPVSRYSFISGTIIFAGVVILALLFSDKYDTNNLYPLFGTVSPKGVLYSVFLFSNVVYLMPIIWKEKNNDSKTGREISKIILISGALITIVCVSYNLYTPYSAIANIQNPLLAVASSVDFDVLFERCEAVVFIMWIFASFISSSALFTFFVDNFSYGANLSDRNAMIGAGAAVVSAISVICDKFSFHEYMYMISLVLTFLLSVIVPVVSFVLCFATRGNKK